MRGSAVVQFCGTGRSVEAEGDVAVGGLECLDRVQGVAFVLAVPDLRQGFLRGGMRRTRQRGKNIGDLVKPAALLGLGEHLAQRSP
jgi:hypothetical protein